MMVKTLRLQQKNSHDDLLRKMENSQDIGVTHQYATSAPQNVPQGCNLAQTIRIVGKDNRGKVWKKNSAWRCVPMPSFPCFVSDREHKQQFENPIAIDTLCAQAQTMHNLCCHRHSPDGWAHLATLYQKAVRKLCRCARAPFSCITASFENKAVEKLVPLN